MEIVKLILELYEIMIALYLLLIDETDPEQQKLYRADIANIRSKLDALNDELEDITKHAK